LIFVSTNIRLCYCSVLKDQLDAHERANIGNATRRCVFDDKCTDALRSMLQQDAAFLVDLHFFAALSSA